MQITEVLSSLEQLSEFTERDKLVHFKQSILHVKVGLLMMEYKCSLLENAEYPNKRGKHPLNEGPATYLGALSLTKQERSEFKIKLNLWY